ncbi:MAG: YdcF family protein [Patescibacteria group bacterium]
MTKQEIISKVKELNLPKGEYVVFGSAPMAMAGIREAGDIDLLVSPEVFESLRKAEWKQIEKSVNDKPLTYDCFEAHDNWDFTLYKPTLKDLLKTATWIEDTPFASLEEVHKWKLASGRPKDLTDIELIEKFYKKRDRLAKIIWDYMLLHHNLKPMDAVFALGSYDTRVAERAAELFCQGYGKYVICAGGFGKYKYFDRSEAEVFGEVVVKNGVPKNKLILEPKSTNTGENVLFVKKLAQGKYPKLKSFILVQKPYMERRTYATFKKQWPEAECLVTSPQLSYEEFMRSDHVFIDRAVNNMLGDLQRIKEYPKLGFQIPQEIPPEIWNAWEKLTEMGYNKFYLKTD